MLSKREHFKNIKVGGMKNVYLWWGICSLFFIGGCTQRQINLAVPGVSKELAVSRKAKRGGKRKGGDFFSSVKAGTDYPGLQGGSGEDKTDHG